jgi:hypothetical protein
MADELNTSAPVDTSSAEPAGMDMEAAVADIASSLGVEDEVGGKGESAAAGGEEKLQPDGSVAAKVDDPSAPTPVAATPAVKAPDTWTKDAQAEFAKLSPTIQAEVQKREGDIAKYVSATNGKVQVADGMEKMLQPYQDIFAQYKVNPWNHMDALLKAHTALMFGDPGQKATMAFALLKDAGIDVTKLAGGNPLDAVGPQNNENQMLRRRIADLERGVTGVTSEIQAQRSAELEQQVVKFAEDPSHPYFYDVWQDIQSLLGTKVCKTLDEAYDKAVWGNPVTRMKEINRKAADDAAKATAAKTQHLNQARRAAGVNARGQANSGGAAVKSGDWEAGMLESLADIRNRQAAT